MDTAERVLSFDEALCIGCQACEVACKAEHDLPVGLYRIRIRTGRPEVRDGELYLPFACTSCRQCPDAPCVEVCPEEALSKRADGIVVMEEALCTNCGLCVSACPYDAMVFAATAATPQHCDLCFHRLDEGEEPFCVKHCMSGALSVGGQEGGAA